MQKHERRITVITTEEFHKAVKMKAADVGKPISDIVRAFLEAWVAGKIEVPDESVTEGKKLEKE